MKHTIIVATSVYVLLTTPAFSGVFADNQETAGRQGLAASTSGTVAVNAGHCESKDAHLPPAERVALMKSCLAEASSPANIKAVAIQQKKAYCDMNAKNKALQGSKKESYLAACMDHNEAQVQYALINRGMITADTSTVGAEYNKTLQEAPTAAGKK